MKKKSDISILLFSLLVIFLWYISGPGVPDNHSGADAVRDNLDRVERIAAGNTEIESRLAESLRLNRKIQSIIQRV